MTAERDALKDAFLAQAGLAGARRERLAGDASTRAYERLYLAWPLYTSDAADE